MRTYFKANSSLVYNWVMLLVDGELIALSTPAHSSGCAKKSSLLRFVMVYLSIFSGTIVPAWQARPRRASKRVRMLSPVSRYFEL